MNHHFPWFHLSVELTLLCRWNQRPQPTYNMLGSFSSTQSQDSMKLTDYWLKMHVHFNSSKPEMTVKLLVSSNQQSKTSRTLSLQWYKIEKIGRYSGWRRQNLRTATNTQQRYTHSSLPVTSLYMHPTFHQTLMGLHWLSLALLCSMDNPAARKPQSTFLLRRTF